MRILLTSTSFQDTPGEHQKLLKETGWDVDYLRGPLLDTSLLPIISKYDGIICGDDMITKEVISRGKNGKLKAISKYGIGLDKIDLLAAEQFHIPVGSTPGVNHVAVAEHALAFMLMHFKNIYNEIEFTKKGLWNRLIGHELAGKKIAIIGLGRIGRELAIRCAAFSLDTHVFDIEYEKAFLEKYSLNTIDSIEDIDNTYDIISLHIPLSSKTSNIIDAHILKKLKTNILIINTSRAAIINKNDLMAFLNTNNTSAYYTDVLWVEPISTEETIHKYPNVFITPHIGSRTYQSVERQGMAAVNNLIRLIMNSDE
jgi:D-3-phosphoglycerate dehydrogenase / 2-oxoglutarate reductase